MILRKSDWHSADIIAALHKKRITLSALSRKAGLGSSTLGNTLIRPWPKGEWLIAESLGVHPSDIWPTRYFDPDTGQPIQRRIKKKTKEGEQEEFTHIKQR